MIGTLAQLKEIFHCPVRVGDEKIDVQSISTDTRTIGPSAVFLALKGDVFDGHDYAKKILEAGALGIIVEQGRFAWAVGNPKVIEVPNTLEAYGKVAKAYRIAKGFKVVGITGSSGKTTTKDMVAQVLGYRFKVEKTQRNNNNEIGLPLTILSASEDTEILVLEMGMRKLGEIAYLTALAQPNYGVITNIGVAHLGELGSKENILQAKGELLEGLPSGSIGLINGEDGYDQELISRASVPVRIFGFGENASIQAINLVSEDGMSRFSLKRDGKTIACVLPFVGKHLILDSLIAIEVGLHFGISIEEGIEALSQLKTAPGRLHPLWIKGALFIDDSYNANPQSMKSSIEILGTYHGNKIAFLGDMRELGTDEASFHREVGQYLVEKGISTLFVLGELGKEIGVGFLQAGGSKDNLHICPSIEVAGQEISDIIKDGDTVLVKGSRAMTMEKVFQYVGREHIMNYGLILAYSLIVFAATFILGVGITWRLTKLKIAQTIRDDGPESHFKKIGTPSMGGVMFLIPLVVVALLFMPGTLLPLIAMTGYGLVGLYDDLDKRVTNKSGGLSIRKKFSLEIIIGVVASLTAYLLLGNLRIGFSQSLGIAPHPFLYTLFIVGFILAVTNGVNFTDGLDGLVTLVSIPVFILFTGIALSQGNTSIATFCILVIAALLAFLFFNIHPAKIFMGDTGSLALGAIIAGVSILLEIQFLLLVFGLIFWLESLSVVIQIIYFKITRGKRFFKMAPLHHHFELSGWKETRVVKLFSGISALSCLLAFILYSWI